MGLFAGMFNPALGGASFQFGAADLPLEVKQNDAAVALYTDPSDAWIVGTIRPIGSPTGDSLVIWQLACHVEATIQHSAAGGEIDIDFAPLFEAFGEDRQRRATPGNFRSLYEPLGQAGIAGRNVSGWLITATPGYSSILQIVDHGFDSIQTQLLDGDLLSLDVAAYLMP